MSKQQCFRSKFFFLLFYICKTWRDKNYKKFVPINTFISCKTTPLDLACVLFPLCCHQRTLHTVRHSCTEWSKLALVAYSFSLPGRQCSALEGPSRPKTDLKQCCPFSSPLPFLSTLPLSLCATPFTWCSEDRTCCRWWDDEIMKTYV